MLGAHFGPANSRPFLSTSRAWPISPLIRHVNAESELHILVTYQAFVSSFRIAVTYQAFKSELNIRIAMQETPPGEKRLMVRDIEELFRELFRLRRLRLSCLRLRV